MRVENWGDAVPEDFDGPESWIYGGMAELSDDLERDEVGTDLIGGKKVWSALEVLTELTNASQVG